MVNVPMVGNVKWGKNHDDYYQAHVHGMDCIFSARTTGNHDYWMVFWLHASCDLHNSSGHTFLHGKFAFNTDLFSNMP